MRLATREQIYKIDQKALREMKLTSSELIERAGKALAEKLFAIAEKLRWNTNTRIAIWCGPGSNGADGRAVAQQLGGRFKILIVEGGDWRVSEFDVIIDALFGVGLNRDISGALKEKIIEINRSRKPVIAIDIPSGVDANRGVILGAAIRAKITITIFPAKPGLFLNEGAACAGRIHCVRIGIPDEILASEANRVFLFGPVSARKTLPSRQLGANKTSFGHLLVIAGSRGMEGAALLVAEAAARMGCGYVSLCSRSEDIFLEARKDHLRLSVDEFFKSDLKKYHAVVIGPGLGVDDESARMLAHVQTNHAKVLVDADALTLLASRKSKSLAKDWVLTPHAGELSRLLGTPAKALEADRLAAVERAAREISAHILLKGFRTVLGTQSKTWIIGSGNVALAKAGSGDVLSGFIGSLMAQGLETHEAALLGAYLHGRIADDWLRRGHSTRTLMASDLPEMIDASLRSLKKPRR